MEASWIYRAGMFDDDAIRALWERYVGLLEAAVDQPGSRIGALERVKTARESDPSREAGRERFRNLKSRAGSRGA